MFDSTMLARDAKNQKEHKNLHKGFSLFAKFEFNDIVQDVLCRECVPMHHA